MKKILLSSALFLLFLAAFSQEKRNGDIYMEHPYINIVNNSVKAYLNKDIAANTKIFSDTAKFWASGMPKRIPIAEALKHWASDFDFYDSIALIKVGYPDYLAYKDQDGKTVQSWWTWKGKSKKTGEVLSIEFVQFDDFNKDGKIVRELIYGDFSKMEH
jgi:hypothetical protein